MQPIVPHHQQRYYDQRVHMVGRSIYGHFMLQLRLLNAIYEPLAVCDLRSGGADPQTTTIHSGLEQQQGDPVMTSLPLTLISVSDMIFQNFVTADMGRPFDKSAGVHFPEKLTRVACPADIVCHPETAHLSTPSNDQRKIVHFWCECEVDLILC